jgi:hypothetical protein
LPCWCPQYAVVLWDRIFPLPKRNDAELEELVVEVALKACLLGHSAFAGLLAVREEAALPSAIVAVSGRFSQLSASPVPGFSFSNSSI